MINVLIADDNKRLYISIFNMIKCQNLENIDVIGITTNGLETYQKIKELRPDIILLDIQLPIMNGFEIINKLLQEKISLPKILLITAFPDSINKLQNIQYISGIIVKPIDCTILYNYLINLNCEISDNNLQTNIIKILNEFDFNKSSLGYLYIIDSIKYCLKRPCCINNLEKDLYPHIAKMHQISNSLKVKWAIDKSLNSMFRYTKTDILKKYFSDTKKISSKLFIKKIIDIIND